MVSSSVSPQSQPIPLSYADHAKKAKKSRSDSAHRTVPTTLLSTLNGNRIHGSLTSPVSVVPPHDSNPHLNGANMFPPFPGNSTGPPPSQPTSPPSAHTSHPRINESSPPTSDLASKALSIVAHYSSPSVSSPVPIVNVWSLRNEQMVAVRSASIPSPKIISQINHIAPNQPVTSSVTQQNHHPRPFAGRDPNLDVHHVPISASSKHLATASPAAIREDTYDAQVSFSRSNRFQPPSILPLQDTEAWPEVGKALPVSRARSVSKNSAKGSIGEEEKEHHVEPEVMEPSKSSSRKSERKKWVPIPPEELQEAADATLKVSRTRHSRSRKSPASSQTPHTRGSGSSQGQSRVPSASNSVSHSRGQSRSGSAHSSPMVTRGRRLPGDDAPSLANNGHLQTHSSSGIKSPHPPMQPVVQLSTFLDPSSSAAAEYSPRVYGPNQTSRVLNGGNINQPPYAGVQHNHHYSPVVPPLSTDVRHHSRHSSVSVSPLPPTSSSSKYLGNAPYVYQPYGSSYEYNNQQPYTGYVHSHNSESGQQTPAHPPLPANLYHPLSARPQQPQGHSPPSQYHATEFPSDEDAHSFPPSRNANEVGEYQEEFPPAVTVEEEMRDGQQHLASGRQIVFGSIREPSRTSGAQSPVALKPVGEDEVGDLVEGERGLKAFTIGAGSSLRVRSRTRSSMAGSTDDLGGQKTAPAVRMMLGNGEIREEGGLVVMNGDENGTEVGTKWTFGSAVLEGGSEEVLNMGAQVHDDGRVEVRGDGERSELAGGGVATSVQVDQQNPTVDPLGVEHAYHLPSPSNFAAVSVHGRTSPPNLRPLLGPPSNFSRAEGHDEWQVKDFRHGNGSTSKAAYSQVIDSEGSHLEATEQLTQNENEAGSERRAPYLERGSHGERPRDYEATGRARRGSYHVGSGPERGGYSDRRGRGQNNYGRGYNRNNNRNSYYPPQPLPPRQAAFTVTSPLTHLQPMMPPQPDPALAVFYPSPRQPLTTYIPTGYETYPPPLSATVASPITPPVPTPRSLLSFPLDPTRWYLLGQLEYYLSPQNLAQDLFLRRQMDSRGWIPISLIASFNRVRQLTMDTNLVRDVLILSSLLQVHDDWVRMIGWEQFILPDATASPVEPTPTWESPENPQREWVGAGQYQHQGIPNVPVNQEGVEVAEDKGDVVENGAVHEGVDDQGEEDEEDEEEEEEEEDIVFVMG